VQDRCRNGAGYVLEWRDISAVNVLERTGKGLLVKEVNRVSSAEKVAFCIRKSLFQRYCKTTHKPYIISMKM
jgi:hypothetical protein